MTATEIIKSVRKIMGLSACVVIAGVVSGATPYQFSVISKDDRAVSFHPCGENGALEDASCTGLAKIGQTEAFVVAPGLTLVSVDPG